MARLEARVVAEQSGETLEHESGADEQHERQRDLEDHERTQRAVLLASRPAAASAAQRVRRVDRGTPPGGPHAAYRADDHRQHERERNYPPIDAEPPELRYLRAGERADRPHAADGQHQPEHDTEPG